MGIERRVMPRVDTSLEISFKTSGVSGHSYMLNLSSGGIFIKTDTPLPIDAELQLSIQLPDDTETMRIRGKVVWTKEQSLAFPAGMGVKFIDLPAAYEKRIKLFVENNLVKNRSERLAV